MRLALYYPIHFIGIFLMLLTIGGMCIYCRNGGEKKENPSRKFLAIVHGISLLLIIVGGMGLMKFYGVFNPMPAWIIIKLCIWLIFGFSSLIIYKFPKFATLFLFLFMLLAALAGLTAKFKSFDYYKSMLKTNVEQSSN